MNSKLKKVVLSAVSLGCVAGIGGIGYKVYDEYFRVVEVSSISVANTTYDLVIGDTGVNVPSIEVLPNDATESKEVVWSSSNEGIATVDTNGIITAKGVGDCKIVCTLVEDSTITAEVQVNVAAIPVSKIEVSDKLTVKEESKKTIEATVNEDATDKTLTYKSSDTAICTVNDKGEVSGVKEGTCEITVSSKDGNTTKTIKVTVDDKWGVEECDPYTMYSIGGNLRKGPSTNHDVIEYQGENTEVTVLGKVADSNWYKCKVGDKTGFMGGTQLQDTKVVHETQSSSSGGNYSYDDSDYSYDGGNDYSYSDSGSSSSSSSSSSSDSGSSNGGSSSSGSSSLFAGLEVEMGGTGGSNGGMTEEGYANAFEGITIH